MAKIYGLNGVLRGRQGNNVFTVQNGTQVVKAYQPVVANPRTNAQMNQRVKFSLAGKMSGATPSLAISGMSGGNARAKRSRFVGKIVKAATVSGSGSSLVASIDYNKVLYSEGSLARYSTVPNVTAAFSGSSINSFVDVSFPAMAVGAVVPEGYGEVGIAALYDAATSTLDEVQAFVRSRTEATTLRFRQGDRRDCFVVAYVAPFNMTSRNGSVSSSNLSGDSSAVSVTGSSSEMLSGAVWGVSNFINVIPVLGTQASVAPNDDRGVEFSQAENGDTVRSVKKK